MKNILLFAALLLPAILKAQDETGQNAIDQYSRTLEADLKTLKTQEERNDKTGMGQTLGSIGELYLNVARNLSGGAMQTYQFPADKKGNLNKSIEYSDRSIALSDEVGDIDQLKKSYKNLSAAQKMSGNLKGAMASYAKLTSLKKNIFTAKKTNEIEKKQLEYMHDRREDSIRKEQQAAEERVKEQQRILSQKQRQLDSANRAITATQQEKNSVSLALQKSQTDLSAEKQSLEEEDKKLTLVEQQRALQATNMQLQQSKLELQKSDLQLQQNKLELQQDELQLKDRVLGHQRTYITIGLVGLIILSLFSFFIIREHRKAVKQRQRAERSERFKQEFIANISHEIRTPMNAINGMTGLLLLKGPRPEQASYLNAISKSSDILLHVINDVLDLSKIESGKLELEKIDFSLSETIEQVKDTLSYRAEDKGLQLVANIDDQLPEVLVGDPYRLNQVLINLGGNALKFTEKGGVHIDVEQVKRENDIVSVKFSISDTGIGIPADKIATLFDSFTQVSSSDTRKYGGTGLGLSISKHLVELHGGSINVESVVGSGATFSFMIDYHVGSAVRLQERLAAEQNIDGSKLSGLRILIADDNEYNRLVVNETLHIMADLHTDLVVNGKETIDMMALHDYDIILMDVQMPVMNGMEATRFIRQQMAPPKNKIPIIALTASVLRADLNLCFESGMTAYVPKPFKPWQLINTIAEVTGRDSGTVPAPKPRVVVKKEQPVEKHVVIPQTETPPAAEISVANDHDRVTSLDYLRKFCEGDEKRMRKYINVYLNALPAFSKNIAEATATKDYTEIALHVHSFKPKWMMMGMKKTNEMGMKIDQLCKTQNEKVFENIDILMADINKSITELEALS